MESLINYILPGNDSYQNALKNMLRKLEKSASWLASIGAIALKMGKLLLLERLHLLEESQVLRPNLFALLLDFYLLLLENLQQFLVVVG